VDLLDLTTGKSHPVLKNINAQIYGPEFSPDAKWISFVAQTGKHSWRAYIAGIPAVGPANRSDWIPATANLDGFLMAFWSQDGNLLYILNEHGEGNLNWLDAQKLDPRNKRPVEQPFNVYRFREPRVPGMDPIWNHPAVGRDKIILELGDMSTNVWLLNVPRRTL
jgi:Tol biopolymer transport system component